MYFFLRNVLLLINEKKILETVNFSTDIVGDNIKNVPSVSAE